MDTRKHPEIELSPAEASARLRKTTRRSLIVGAVSAVVGAGFWEWMTRSGDIDNVPWPQRRILGWNERLTSKFIAPSHQAGASQSKVGGVKPNGDYGLSENVSAADWKVRVEVEGAPFHKVVTLDEIRAMPRTDQTTRFCCIEGWSGVAHWSGLQFAEFTRRVLPPEHRELPYVYMATSDEEYYVGLDRKSAMHPQTLLAYEQNGKPLELRRGAPLRLAIPVKYGIKNIKQVALIRYTKERPGDYWAEEGYDWFAGL